MTKLLAKRAWLTVGLLWVVALLNYLDRLMITTMRDPIEASITMTDAQFGLLTSAFLWVYGIFSPLGGYLADRFSRRWVILASLFIWSTVTWATGHMHTFEGLLTARAVMGLSEACYIPAALALIADYHRGSTRSLATGIHMSGIYAGAALGGVGGVIAEHHGWRSSFSWFGVIGIVYAVIAYSLLRDALEPETTAAASASASPRKVRLSAALRALIVQPAFILLLVIDGLVGIANWGIYGWLPTYLKEHFHLGLGEAGMTATSYIQIASFAGVIAGGIWADRWVRTQPRARALVPAIGFCLAGPCLFFGIGSASLLLAISVLVIYGLGRGLFDANLMPVVRTIADERFSATGYGLLNLVSVAAGGAMIYVGGWLKDSHVDLSTTFQLSAAGMFIVGILLFAVRPRASTTR